MQGWSLAWERGGAAQRKPGAAARAPELPSGSIGAGLRLAAAARPGARASRRRRCCGSAVLAPPLLRARGAAAHAARRCRPPVAAAPRAAPARWARTPLRCQRGALRLAAAQTSWGLRAGKARFETRQHRLCAAAGRQRSRGELVAGAGPGRHRARSQVKRRSSGSARRCRGAAAPAAAFAGARTAQAALLLLLLRERRQLSA
jgi:hypothetical protein